MGILESVVGGLLGGGAGGGTASPMGGVLMNMLGGGGQASGLSGGLGGLVSSFEQAGLGHVAQSWIGNGPNQPVSPQQLQGVFGQDRVRQMAGQAGMEPDDFLSQLSRHLPDAVHGVTPDGQSAGQDTVSI